MKNISSIILFFCFVVINISAQEMFGGERFFNRQGTVYDTVINTDHVNIHFYPSLQSDIIFRVSSGTRVTILGTSKNADIIDGYTGHWLAITVLQNQPVEFVGNLRLNYGWVFSRFVDNGNIVPNEIRILGFGPEQQWETRLVGVYMLGDTEVQFSVRAKQMQNQSFWTFLWNHNYGYLWDSGINTVVYDQYFRFDTVPGTYVWFPETGELRHISHIGAWPQSCFVRERTVIEVTDDLRFIIQRWPEMGIHSFQVRRTDCATLVYSGDHFISVRLNDNVISDMRVMHITWFEMPSWEGTSALVVFMREFLKNYPEPPEDFLNATAIFAEFNLDTGIQRIIEARWIYMM